MSLTEQSANVRAESFLVILALTRCPHCGVDTEVAALAVPRAHHWRDEESPNSWYRATAPAVLFHVAYLTPALAAAVAALSPGYRSTGVQGDTFWCNHCASCRQPLPDDELHCEPGGVFMPLAPDGVRYTLKHVRAPFAALTGGYAPEPPFYPEFPD